MTPLAVLGLLAAVSARSGPSMIPEAEEYHQGERPASALAADLADPDRAEAALAALKRRGRPLPALEEVALHTDDPSARGRALLAIRDIPGQDADAVLVRLSDDPGTPPLVRAWAVAARIQRADDLDAWLALANRYQGAMPELARPFEQRAQLLLSGENPGNLIKVLSVQPSLAAAIGPKILALPADVLVAQMQRHPDDGVRRTAASYLASKGAAGEDRDAVAAEVVRALRYDADAAMPWAGGALYVPAIAWEKDPALDLVRELIRWNLYFDRTGQAAERQQVQNNLRSVQLLAAAGFQNRWPDVNGAEVLVEYGRLRSRAEVQDLLAEQPGLDARWSAALDQLRKER